MSNSKVPYVFTHKCFKYDSKDLQKQSFMTECTYCSRPLLANKADGWSGLYTHLKSKVHLKNVQYIKQQQMSQFEIENDLIDDDNDDYNCNLHETNEQKFNISSCNSNSSNYQENKSLNDEDSNDLKLKIKLKEEQLKQINRDNEIYKSSIEYTNRIKEINEQEIENLRNKILSASDVMINYDLSELKNKIKLLEGENELLKQQNLQVEKSVDYLRSQSTNTDKEIQKLTKQNLQLNIQINELNELMDMFKKELGLSNSISDFDNFEQELIKHFETISNENKSLKDKLIEKLINM
jgi:chromosome segregation ATPase